MSRRYRSKKRVIVTDPIYDSHLIHIIVNQLMKKGKKSLAYKMFYESMNLLKKNTQQDPVKTIEQAVRNATPIVEVKPRRVGGSTYQVPIDVTPERGTAFAIRWILSSCRNRSGKNMIAKLTNEFLDASNNIGNAIKKKNEIHKTADANKAFAKYKF